MAALDAAIFFVGQKMPVSSTGMMRFVECESLDKLRLLIPLQIKQRGEVAVIDAEGHGFLHFRLGMECYAHAGCLQHRNIIGAVADGNGIGGGQAVHQC